MADCRAQRTLQQLLTSTHPPQAPPAPASTGRAAAVRAQLQKEPLPCRAPCPGSGDGQVVALGGGERPHVSCPPEPPGRRLWRAGTLTFSSHSLFRQEGAYLYLGFLLSVEETGTRGGGVAPEWAPAGPDPGWVSRDPEGFSAARVAPPSCRQPASVHPGVPRGPGGLTGGAAVLEAGVALGPVLRFWPWPGPFHWEDCIITAALSSHQWLSGWVHTQLGVSRRRLSGLLILFSRWGPLSRTAPVSTPAQILCPFLHVPQCNRCLFSLSVLVLRLSPGPEHKLCEVKTFICCSSLRTWPPEPGLALSREPGNGCQRGPRTWQVNRPPGGCSLHVGELWLQPSPLLPRGVPAG